MIESVSISRSANINSARPTGGITSQSLPGNESIPRDTSAADVKMSTLSRQLADSAVRAEQRDKTMDRRQLAAETRRIMSKMAESDWRLDRPDYKIEYPDTSDPELLQRARQAAEYVARYAHGHTGAKNPFAGLSREQLNLIVYDDQGPYTMDERSAARCAVEAIESEWNRGLWGPADRESAANNGRTPKFYAEVLAHYRSLEPIEQAQYPDNYESRLERQIKEASDPMAAEKQDDFELLTLFELFARYGFPADKKKPGILDSASESDATTAQGASLGTAVKTSS